MKNKVILFVVFTLLSEWCFSGVFNSAASGNWHVSTTWTLVSGTDADGVPDADDNATILTGHTVTISTTGPASGSAIMDLTIDAGGNLTMQRSISYYGNYTNNGSETATSFINTYFRGVGKTISGSGTFANLALLNFAPSSTTTIAAGTVINKPNPTTTNFYTNAIVTNNGTFHFWNTNLFGTGQVFNNGATGVLRIGYKNFMLGRTFNASTVGNTVQIEYSGGILPTPTGATYHNLTIVSPNASLSQSIIVNGNLSVLNTGGLNASTFNIDVNGSVSLNGVWNPSSGQSLTLSGTGAQTISTTATTVRNFTNLIIDNPTSVTLTNGSYQLSETLTILQGTFNLNNRSFIMTSNAATTAVIGTCGPTAAFTNTNNFTLQRFVSARSAGYSDVSASKSGQTFAELETNNIMVYDYSPPDYYPSAYRYSEMLADYIPITANTVAMVPGTGYEVYLDSDGGQANFNASTFNFVGTPNVGDLDISSSVTFASDGWNLVGNPYHANISWDALNASSTDISTDFMYFDETINDFATASTGAGELIAPCQGFWVQALSATPVFTFTEAIKSTSLSSTYRSKERENFFCLRLKNVGDVRFTSGTNFRFSADPRSAIKGNLPNKRISHPEAPYLGSLSNEGKNLKINLLNSTENSISIPLYFEAGVNGKYTIEEENIDLAFAEGYTCIILYDTKLGVYADLSQGKYQFDAEKGEDKHRFLLMISKSTNCLKSEDVTMLDPMVVIYQSENDAVLKFDFDSQTEVMVEITDLLGKKLLPIQSLTVSAQESRLQMPSDFKGIYLVNVYYNNKHSTYKLFK